MVEWDDEGDDWSDDEWPEDPDDEEAAVIGCPSCGAEIYEQAECCPVCGEYVIRSSYSAWDAKPLWWIALGAVGIVAMIAALTAI